MQPTIYTVYYTVSLWWWWHFWKQEKGDCLKRATSYESGASWLQQCWDMWPGYKDVKYKYKYTNWNTNTQIEIQIKIQTQMQIQKKVSSYESGASWLQQCWDMWPGYKDVKYKYKYTNWNTNTQIEIQIKIQTQMQIQKKVTSYESGASWLDPCYVDIATYLKNLFYGPLP